MASPAQTSTLEQRTGLKQIYLCFLPELRHYQKTLALAVVCMACVTILELLRPWPMKIIFDVLLVPQEKTLQQLSAFSVLVEDKQLLLAVTVASILGMAVLAGLAAYWQSVLVASVGQKVVAAVRHRMYCHIQRLSHTFHEDTATGDMLARLTGDIRMMRELLVNAAIYISDRSLLVICMLLVMAYMDWQLTLFAVCIIPLLFLTVGRFSSNIKGATRKQRQRESQITHTLNEKLSAISLVQVFAREAHEEQQFARQNDKSLQAGLVATRLEAQMNRYVQLIMALGTACVLWFGVRRVEVGILTPGDLLVFTTYLAGLYKPIRKLSSITGRLAKASASGERILAILNTQPDIVDAPDAIEAPPFKGDIEFRHVSFNYPNGVSVFSNASFHLSAGSNAVLYGESGIGKSTLFRLLFRFYDPQEGQILIDNKDIRCYTLESLRSQIAVVLQESTLFNTSIRDNIAYGKLDATDDEIEQAAKRANAHEFIDRLPNGYDTIVSERGSSLSGGQRQRIAIARAIIRQARIVVLDEPSTGLDAENRAQVQSSLAALTAGVTCLTITHEPETLSDVDYLLQIMDKHVLCDEVMHNGSPVDPSMGGAAQ